MRKTSSEKTSLVHPYSGNIKNQESPLRFETSSDFKMSEHSKHLLESKAIKELESILSNLSKYNRVPGTLSINDVAHSFFLMKAFIVYPRNYGNIKFETSEA
jgi:hypothetical protein